MCIFAYGQTGSGKTHTMAGSDVEDYAGRGINYRALDDLFAINEERQGEVRLTSLIIPDLMSGHWEDGIPLCDKVLPCSQSALHYWTCARRVQPVELSSAGRISWRARCLTFACLTHAEGNLQRVAAQL